MKQKKLTACIIALTSTSVASVYSATPPLYLNFSRPEISFKETRAYSLLSVNTPFSITLNFSGELTDSQKAVFLAAKSAWESRISGYQPGISISGVTIDASSDYIDGQWGTLGRAGPTNITSQAGHTLAVKGIMEFDSADMTAMENNGFLQAVIEHEMGHVLGIGTLWSFNSAYTKESFQYTGTNGIDAWNVEFSPNAALSYVPVEDDGGEGTRNGHWDENNQGQGETGYKDPKGRDMKYELMTGWINLPVFFSDTTLYSMIDLGFTVAQPQVELSIHTSNAGKVIGSGVDCTGDCTVSFNTDTEILLEAIAEHDHYFSGWSGDCTGDETCNLALDSNISVTATFLSRPTPAIECATGPIAISGTYTQDTLIQSERDINISKDADIAKHVRLTIESATAIRFEKEFKTSKYAQIAADIVAGLSCGGMHS
jgi:hypothetical protein